MFQLTRPRGARQLTHAGSPGMHGFQLTRPRGARPLLTLRAQLRHRVSTHAPAWGATCSRRHAAPRAPRVSTHAPAWGATQRHGRAHSERAMFQLTRPRGARLKHPQQQRDAPPSFNSRARVGRDATSPDIMDDRQVFQLTRPRGARPGGPPARRRRGHVSTHAPAWGATHRGQALEAKDACFNSRARVGRDHSGVCPYGYSRCFNSRARVGRD